MYISAKEYLEKQLKSNLVHEIRRQGIGDVTTASTYTPPFTSAERNITEEDAPKIFEILCGPSPWQKYLVTNFKAHRLDLPQKPIRIVDDYAFGKKYKAVFGSAAAADAQGFVDRRNALIYLKEFPSGNRGQSKVGLALHEAVHLFSHPPGKSNKLKHTFYGFLGTSFVEGLTQVITEDILVQQGINPLRENWQAYKDYVPVARKFIALFSPETVAEVYFSGNGKKLFDKIRRRWGVVNFQKVAKLTTEKKTNQALRLITDLEQAYKTKYGKVQIYRWDFR